MIDWTPFPSIRDRIIGIHASDPDIHRIVCDVVSAYVVETPLLKILLSESEMKVFIRVIDLISVMALEQVSDLTNDTEVLSVPSIESLRSSPRLARHASRILQIDRGASVYKVNPEFFGKYPELFDASNDIIASGVPLRLNSLQTLSSSSPLDLATMEVYRSFIGFCLDTSYALLGNL